jgi:acyl-CoA reductase-like NAD-dependent aldehyde dehydrogenase
LQQERNLKVSSYKLLIDGQLVDGAATIEVINPAEGKVLATAPRADEAQLNLAVAAAKRAFPAWAALKPEEREAKLNQLADAIEAQADDFARLLTQEQGKPIGEAQAEVMGATFGLRAFAAMRAEPKELQLTETARVIEVRRPLGVCAGIVPWNFPVLLMVMKVGPCLALGNTMVLKPAPTTPLTTLKFGELAAGILPAGVLNIIVDENDLGSVLTAHPDVAKVSFTGSTATGKKVMQSVASDLKRLTLELGGNDAAIVLDDADIKQVAPVLFASAMTNSGQICLATKRVYAHSSHYDELCDELAILAKAAVMGDGTEQGVTMGPLQNKMQYEKVKGFLLNAKEEGTVIAGGEVGEGDGYFIQPTIVRDIPDSARLVREEQFGPVLPILKYDDVADAVARANDSEYGLGGTVWTSNIERGIEVANQVDSGTIWINKFLDLPFDVPFRGAKQSGMGGENGEEAVAAYTQAKIINVAL